MPIQHLITLQSSISQYFSGLTNEMPIGIIGTSESGALDTIIKVSGVSDLSQFGLDDPAQFTLVNNLKILQRYGCNNIYAIRVAKGVDANATNTNLIGSNTGGVKTGIQLFENMPTLFNDFLRWLVFPGFNSTTLIAQALTSAEKTNTMVAVDFSQGTSTATATTTRGTSTGLGSKNKLLHPCMPQVKVGSVFESLACHLAGLQALVNESLGFGFSSSNQFLLEIDGIEAGFNLSYTDSNADNQVLESLGVVSVNAYQGKYVLWGNRNASFVNNVNEGFDTYTSLYRIQQELDNLLIEISKGFIDQPCNAYTAKLLETAYNNVVNSNVNKGNYKAESFAKWNESLSNFSEKTLAYDVVIYGNLPTETINVTNLITV